MSNQVIQPGKYVALTYAIVDQGGDIVEQHDVPLGFVFGSDTELVAGMDKAVAGKSVGDRVEVSVSAEEGFGPYDPSLSFTDSIDHVPPEFHQVGAEVEMQSEDGETKVFYVTRIENGEITVDGNHPLAGMALTIRVLITEVRDARPGEEQMSGIHAFDRPGPTSIN